MSLEHHASESIYAAGKASPALAVTGATVAGVDLQTWVLIATLVYTVLQVALLVYNFIKDRLKEED